MQASTAAVSDLAAGELSLGVAAVLSSGLGGDLVVLVSAFTLDA